MLKRIGVEAPICPPTEVDLELLQSVPSLADVTYRDVVITFIAG